MSLEFFAKNYLPEMQRTKPGKVALLCNQTAYSHFHKKYLFELLSECGCLGLLLVPEHGLFGELQDQIGLNDTRAYQELVPAEILSLYQDTEESLYIPLEKLRELDVLIVDIQDVGSRYYTFATTLSYIFDILARHSIFLRVLVIERPNPAGRMVEGVCLSAEYQSFVGRAGLPHRHGLTIGELARFYQSQAPGPYQLEVVYDPQKVYIGKPAESLELLLQSTEIFPSPNMPGPLTPLVYSGQCLLEGTNLSEGRGTTRPFEIFGAPYLKGKREPPRQRGAHLRPLRFIPTFHKFADSICEGFQIHLERQEPYHSLAHSLKILRWVQEAAPRDFAWRREAYEFCSLRPAIQILAGDPLLLDYLYGRENCARLRKTLQSGEEEWIQTSRPYLLHAETLKRTELDPKEDFG